MRTSTYIPTQFPPIPPKCSNNPTSSRPKDLCDDDIYCTVLTMASTIDHMLAKNALLNAAFDKAIVSKLDCQLHNTKKQYKCYQRQWDVKTNINYNYTSQDLTNIFQEFCKKHDFPDGVIVTEKKVCLWLQEDILLQQVLLKTTKVKGNGVLGKRKASSDCTKALILLYFQVLIVY